MNIGKRMLAFFTALIITILFVSSCEQDSSDSKKLGINPHKNYALNQFVSEIEAEEMTISGPYAGVIDSPFNGVALYGGDDAISTSMTFSTVPGEYRLDLRGASNNSSTAVATVYVDGQKIGNVGFPGTTASTQSLTFSMTSSAGEKTIEINGETDDGSWDVFLDWAELYFEGEPAPLPDAPAVAGEALYTSREYRNMFVEWGKTEAEVQAKIDDMVGKFFYGEDGGGWQIYQEVGSDMAYIHTVDTNDVRSEGMSYGMMICVQLDMKEEFDKLWKWTKTYMQHQTDERIGYFAWQVGISGNIMDQNPAPDGEEYFAMALFFAANRWGNGTDIYNYEAEANNILDDMIRHKQKRGLTYWEGSALNMIDEDAKQIVLSTIGQSATFTDPSYHLPHFYELFHRMADPSLRTLWADGEAANGDIPARKGITWLEMADVSRQLFKNATHSTTGLVPAYSDFDGTPNASNPGVYSDKFSYDSWRVAANIAQDYLWFKSDDWQKDTWGGRYLGFFYDEGVSSHGNLYELDGTQISGDHSPGLVAMNAVAATIYEDQNAWKFIEELWNITPTEGTYRYYDGCLYLFGMLNVSGNYRIYDGGEVVDPDPEPDPDPTVPDAPSYLSASAVSESSITLNWSDNSNDESGFKVERTNGGTYTQIATLSANSTSYSDSALVLGTQYTYRICAYNSVGDSSYSSSASATTDTVVDPEPDPTLKAIPGTIEAEDYDEGAYNDTTSGNSGNLYRSDDVDIESCSEGGYNVGWIASGEWLEYSVNVEETANYTVEIRVASLENGGTFTLALDGADIVSQQSFNATGGWQSWTTVTINNVSLNAGAKVLRLGMESSGWNVNWIRFTKVTSTDPDPDLSDPMDPFKVNQAEDFTDSNGVTIVNGDGGSVVRFDSTSGWISFEYDFSSGPQTIDIRSASAGWGANVYFKVDSSDGQTFSTIYPNGGGLWYTNSNSCWPRPTGVKTVYIMTNKAGLELNWFEIKK